MPTLESITELKELFEKMGRVHYEMLWFGFGVGQLGAVADIGSEEDAAAMIYNVRGDILDYAKAAKELSEQMEQLVSNVEEILERRDADA